MSAKMLQRCMVVALFGVSNNAVAQECSCTKYPFEPDPPCWTECTAHYLQHSDTSTLQKVLGLSKPLATKIADASTVRDESFLTAPVDREVTDKFLAKLHLILSRQESNELSAQLQALDEGRAEAWLDTVRLKDSVAELEGRNSAQN